MKPLVKVLWRDIAGIDSADNSSSWFTEPQIIKKASELYNQEYVSIGYLVAERPEFIVIAATTDNDEEAPLWSDASMIMKSVIIQMNELSGSKEK